MDKKKKAQEEVIEEVVDALGNSGDQPGDEKQQAAIDALVAEKDQWHAKYLRALADYQNLQTRMDSQRIQIREAEAARVLVSLLPFLDNLDAAGAFVTDPGLMMIRQQFAKLLQELGLIELDLIDKPFDPHTAEAIEVVAADQDDMVVEVLRKGYRYNDTVVRPAQVKVGKRMQ